VEHVGSTAVPMEGRPVIDLLLGVPDPAQVQRLPDYEARGGNFFRRRNGIGFDVRAVELRGSTWSDALLLRDYLRAHPEEAARCASAKRDALQAGATTLRAYTAAKEPVLADLLAKARA
jgi:GrpB-like predicted nucleotidyltransferase (UPF0157 family)